MVEPMASVPTNLMASRNQVSMQSPVKRPALTVDVCDDKLPIKKTATVKIEGSDLRETISVCDFFFRMRY